MSYTDERGVFHNFHSVIQVSLNDFREVTTGGAVGAIAANGGILASDTTPILRNASGVLAQEISWAAANVDPILCQFALPGDFDGRSDVLMDLWVYSGTTDPATFTISASYDGGATATYTATDGAKSATMHKITGILLKADIPDNCELLTIMLTPGTHATNAIQLQGARIRYTPKIQG